MHHGSAVLTVHGGKTICRRVLGSRGGGRADEGGGFEMRSAVPIAAPTGLDRERPAEAAPLCGRLLRSAESNRYSPCENLVPVVSGLKQCSRERRRKRLQSVCVEWRRSHPEPPIDFSCGRHGSHGQAQTGDEPARWEERWQARRPSTGRHESRSLSAWRSLQ
jgi:hypothetical protein